MSSPRPARVALDDEDQTAERAEIAENDPLKKEKRLLCVLRVLRGQSHRRPCRRRRCWRAPRSRISGFAALMYEVAWTRLLALVIGPTTYAFATMAAAFISGLAIGLGARARGWRGGPARPAVWLRDDARRRPRLPRAPRPVSRRTGCRSWSPRRWPIRTVAFSPVVVTQALGTALLLLPMTLALGATFPLALAVAAGGASTRRAPTRRGSTPPTRSARSPARWPPGSCSSLRSACDRRSRRPRSSPPSEAPAAWPSLSAGQDQGATADHGPWTRTAGQARTGPGTIVWPAAVAVAAVAAILALPAWDRELLASGAYKYAPYLGATISKPCCAPARSSTTRKARPSTVSVRRLTGTRSLAIDGKVDASNAGDMLTQRLLGLLPVLLHGHAQDICRHRSGQRRHRRLRAGARHRRARRRRRDLAGGRRGVALLRSRKRQRAVATGRPADRRRRPVAPAADAAALRRHRLGAVESVDVGRRGALHARVLRGGASAT